MIDHVNFEHAETKQREKSTDVVTWWKFNKNRRRTRPQRRNFLCWVSLTRGWMETTSCALYRLSEGARKFP